MKAATRTRRQVMGGMREVRWIAMGALTLSLLVAGCDQLLDVDLPGNLTEGDLNDPRLAETLAFGVQGEFECAFSSYLVADALWTQGFFYASNNRSRNVWSQRGPAADATDESNCASQNPPSTFLPFQVVRTQGDRAVTLIEGFPAGSVDGNSKEFFLAQAHAYTGYAYLILGEAMCELSFDGGPKATREDSWRLAQQRFTVALAHADRVSSGPVAAARSIRNMALVGRARASLNLGEVQGVLNDAGQVDEGFVRYATASEAEDRRWNQLYNLANLARELGVNPDFVGLEVDGVPDPRVPISGTGAKTGFDGVTEMWFQQKYPTRSSDMPFASWREAQLMIAEVAGGQTAVNVINTLRATHQLPEFESDDPGEIAEQVLEERRRELWLQGTRLGDILRLGLDFPFMETDHRGRPIGPWTCMPLPVQEREANQNL